MLECADKNLKKKKQAEFRNGEYAPYTFIEDETEFEKLVQKMG